MEGRVSHDTHEMCAAQWREERAELLRQLTEKDAQIVELEGKTDALQERVGKHEEQLRTNSKNSSQPASQDRPAQKAARTSGGQLPDGQKRAQGGQKGHPGRTREPFKAERVERVVPVPCTSSCDCGGVVVPDGRYKPIQQVELPPIQVLVTEFRLGSGHCRDCGKWHQGSLPEDVVPGLLGPGVLALVATLVGEFQLSRQRVTGVLGALLGFEVSPATVSAAEEKVGEALAAP